jgi:hypothetical protein
MTGQDETGTNLQYTTAGNIVLMSILLQYQKIPGYIISAG